MFYANRLLLKKETNMKIVFSKFASGMTSEIDDDILPCKYAKICYNYHTENGALKNGLGFKKLSLPTSTSYDKEREIIIDKNTGIKALWHYKYYDTENDTPQDSLLFYTEGGRINWISLVDIDPYAYPIASMIYSNGIPNGINYRLNGLDTMIFSSKTDGMWKYTHNYYAQKIENGPSITSMCLHYERLFAILDNNEKHRLTFSANLDPTNWDETLTDGGFIDMQDERGALNKVVSFNDYVYVFRDFGVARVSAYGDQTNFSVSQLFVSSAKIYGNSVCVCGDKILLLTRDGIHTFDGYATVKLNLNIENLFKNTNNDNCCSLYYNNKYYLACNLNFNDCKKVGCENYSGGYINNAIIEYDIKSGSISITRGVDICSMIMIDNGGFSKVAVCFNGEYKDILGEMTNDGNMFGVPLQKCWQSPKSAMGYLGKIKHIKEIFIKTKSPCEIVITSEKHTKTYKALGQEKTQRIKTNVYGEQIQIEFNSNTTDDILISCPELTIGVS